MARRPLWSMVAAGALTLACIGGAGAAAAVENPQPAITPPSLPIASLPIDLGLTPSTTAASTAPAPPPAGVPVADDLPAPPALPQPGALPAVPLPGAGGAGETEPTDPCAQIPGPASEQGAPIAATCPVTPASDGGVDIPICIDIAKVATCSEAAAVTTTTMSSAGGSGPGTGGSGSTATGSSGTAAPTAGGSTAGDTSTDVRGTGETLPLTGSAIVWLLTIGTALAATGGALARVARRRFS